MQKTLYCFIAWTFFGAISLADSMSSYLNCAGAIDNNMIVLSSPTDLATRSGIVQWRHESLLFYYQNAIISVQKKEVSSLKEMPFQIFKCPYELPADATEINFELTGYPEVASIFAQIFPSRPQILDSYTRKDPRQSPPPLASAACTKVTNSAESAKIKIFIDDVFAESAVKNCNRIAKFLKQPEPEGRLSKISLERDIMYQADACSQLQPFVADPKLLKNCGSTEMDYVPATENFKYLRRD